MFLGFTSLEENVGFRVTRQVLLRDFGLLEEVDAAVDRANRDLRIRDEDRSVSLALPGFARSSPSPESFGLSLCLRGV